MNTEIIAVNERVTREDGITGIHIALRGKVPKRDLNGYVYIVEFKGGVFKIGASKMPIKRLKYLLNDSADGFIIHCLIRSQQPFSLEKALHETFENKKVKNEHFLLAPEDIHMAIDIANQFGRGDRLPNNEVRLDLEPELQKELTVFMSNYGISVMDKQAVIKFYLSRGMHAKDAQEYAVIEELGALLDERKAARSRRQKETLAKMAAKGEKA